jgi:hypothetical protein
VGYNTVAFFLNDFMHELVESPKALAFGICHPPSSDRDDDQRRWRDMVASVARENDEPVPHPQAVELLGTFHADFTQWLAAGGNCITTLKFMRYGTTKDGKLTVTLELPEGWPGHPKNRSKYR